MTVSYVDAVAAELGLSPLEDWGFVEITKKEALKFWGIRVGRMPYKSAVDGEAVKLALINPALSAWKLKKDGKVEKVKMIYAFGVVQAAVDLTAILIPLLITQFSILNLIYYLSLPILVRMAIIPLTTRIHLYKCAKCNRIVLETAKKCPKCGTQL